jgi:toxin-antitoxin system PIN domain toxin
VSYALDVNVLLYAGDEGSPLHALAREFLGLCAAGPEVLCLGWPTLMSYLRMATNPRIFGRPLTPEAAESNVTALLALPHVRALAEQEGFWEVYRRVTRGLAVRGSLVPDAHLTALLVQHGVTVLYTHDADFRRFRDLQVRDPFT